MIMLKIVNFQLEKQIALQKRIKELQLIIQRQADLGLGKFKQLFLRTQEEQKILLELAKRGRNVVNEHSFSFYAKWNAIYFVNATEENITFLSYFRRYEDLYNTDCTKSDDFKKVHLLLSKLGTAE